MATMIEKTGKTVEDALQAALDDLGVAADDVDYEILESPSKGFFGFGAKPAKIRVTVKEIPPPPAPPKPVETITRFEATVEDKIAPAETVEVETEIVEVEAEPEQIFDRDAVIAAAKNFLNDVFAAMNVNAAIDAVENDSEVTLNLSGKNLGVLIGKHGQTLDALQYLTNLAANRRDSADKIYFVLDVENYRERRAEALKKLAKSVAERAIRTRQDVRLEPMSRSERRIIHTVLQDNEKVETHSAGEDPYRYIIVSPKRRGR